MEKNWELQCTACLFQWHHHEWLGYQKAGPVVSCANRDDGYKALAEPYTVLTLYMYS